MKGLDHLGPKAMPFPQDRSRAVADDFRRLQDDISSGLEAFELTNDGNQFVEDIWDRPGGGGGRTRVLTGGSVWERGGVNFSEVMGETNEALQKQLQSAATQFWASGVSLVLHPRNPHVPIVHMNVRHFALNDGTSWFGGGIDLTPHYIDVAEAKAFHVALKNICDTHECADYHEFKDNADQYFFLPHRNETRGIGGIFFDHLGRKHESHEDWDNIRAFVMDVGEGFLNSYMPLVKNKIDQPYSAEQRDWQLHRRGRYAEFNLVWDRGTRFGLESNGRTESILMSLPPEARWTYSQLPGPEEQKTLSLLRQGVPWVEGGN